MTPCAAALLAVLEALPNRPPGFAEHAAVVATAIDRATDGTREAASLLTIGFWESGFQPRIQAGQCEKWECDPYRGRDGQIHHRARSYYQLWASPIVPRADWDRLLGLDQPTVDFASVVAFRVLRRGFRACGTVTGALSYYAVAKCKWSKVKRRADFAAWAERRLGACAK